ncbi:MAG: hypothetical protein ACREIJ_05815 [Nitrospiraceae bacterium]
MTKGFSKSRDESIKETLENTVAREFLLSYNHATRSRFRIIRKGKPPEPDVICRDASSHEQIGIEVAVAYYDYGGRHAKAIWGPTRGKRTDPYFLARPDFEANSSVLAHAARIIKGKATKSYSGRVSRAFLTILLFPDRLYLSESEMEERLSNLRLPRDHPFTEIHILSQHGEVYRLFPKHGWVLG